MCSLEGNSEALRARRQTGVYDDNRAAGISGMIGSQECDHRSDFLRRGGTPEWQRLEQVAPVFGVAGAVLCLLAHQADQAVGGYRAGIDGDDPNAVARA